MHSEALWEYSGLSGMILSKVAKETEEKADKKIRAAKASLQKRDGRKRRASEGENAAEKEATDEHTRKTLEPDSRTGRRPPATGHMANVIAGGETKNSGVTY